MRTARLCIVPGGGGRKVLSRGGEGREVLSRRGEGGRCCPGRGRMLSGGGGVLWTGHGGREGGVVQGKGCCDLVPGGGGRCCALPLPPLTMWPIPWCIWCNTDPPPPLGDRMTNTCKNITFTRYAGGNNDAFRYFGRLGLPPCVCVGGGGGVCLPHGIVGSQTPILWTEWHMLMKIVPSVRYGNKKQHSRRMCTAHLSTVSHSILCIEHCNLPG